LPAILAKEGYRTSFFHGGRNGTMGFDDFSKVTGIQKYYGLDQYKGSAAFDGGWGISDEEFMQFFASELSNMPQPFFSTLFTLSSHHPYNIPVKHKTDFLDAPNPFLRSIEYADYSLGRFFATVAKMPWYNNTLFILLADHAGQEYLPRYSTQAGIFRIPIVFFHPGDFNFKGKSQKVAQQTDIMPTVLNYLGIQTPFVAYGKNLFDKTRSDFASGFLGGLYHYVYGNYFLLFDGTSATALYNYNTDTLLTHNLLADSSHYAIHMETQLKAMIQQYNFRLLNNKMSSTVR
jgi:phosphoglycerol transferase MdoB-like AlkP superfamily enzyme